ncbi:5'-hydroxyaverantin dehydrogenase [Pseudocercospora fuligena]|uniref:5'-hydroxyaverantin dehydrogenase n=1 Tax=Pseudocercospora fuligena TaxID=685502 RepID=A0A8H6VGY1_9PEZI|nr:5'-hydroxyaverantin dehydrogenase [Pseudocercospora fuligena]
MAPNRDFTKNEVIAGDAGYDSSQLNGKSVVLTGGASGLGEQFVRSFVEAGAYVTFGDLAEDRGKALADKLGAAQAAFVPCDVTKWADQLRLFKTALQNSPSKTIDIVVANAGISGSDDVFLQAETDDGDPIEPILNVVKVNFIGVLYTVKLALFYLPKQPEGEDRDRCIIMTGSLASYLDQSGSPQYNASKWGVRGLMHSIRQTGPDKGIRINMVAPWFVDTRIMSDEVKSFVRGRGIEFCNIEDGGSLVCHFAADKSINGRAFLLIPRSVNKRGYIDAEHDDWNDDDFLTEWQHTGRKNKFRMLDAK